MDGTFLFHCQLSAPNSNTLLQLPPPTMVLHSRLLINKPISISVPISPSSFSLPITSVVKLSSVRLKSRVFLKQSSDYSHSVSNSNSFSSVHYDSLRVLQWDKLCDSVASFAGTSLGREATKAKLWYLNYTYEESRRLLDETNAAVEMHKHGGCTMDFSGIDVLLVKSAIQHSRRGLSIDAKEAMAVVALLQFAESLQFNLKTTIKEDSEWYGRFMPLTEVIMEMVICQSLVRSILQVIDEDGSVKDSASSTLKQSRNQVRMLERKIAQLMDNIIKNQTNDSSSLDVTILDGRWCVKSGADVPTNLKGLLLSSGSGSGSIVEPFSSISLNDDLQQARALVAKAEEDVLLMLAKKVEMELDDIEKLLSSMIQLDVINARATYSLSFGGTCPDIFLQEENNASFAAETYLPGSKTSEASSPVKRKWTLYLPKAYHPLLLLQHRENLQKARKDMRNARADIERRRQQGANLTQKGEIYENMSNLEMHVTMLEKMQPVPVDFFISPKSRVLVITGPNAGGKTICLKTVGLAAMMAKSGLHILASEPARIPWFDYILADIGDDQSLSQSLSTFSSHLKQISDIQSQSTRQSLVLLDEVGAGTNPLEGAALGMSLLESFVKGGALLTIATTHHSELKALKYSNDAFENACMEFDEVNLKPTYRILWGIPGRSNAINVAERLGVPNVVVENARELYGASSTEINEVIIDMEKLKQKFQELLHKARHHLL